MATLLFYQKPVQLNTEVHKNVRLRALNGDFGFARETNSIPLAAVEFFDAAREYPIAFSGTEPGKIFPIGIFGVRQNENLFVAADGRWEGLYIPAFVRRYPFVLAEKQDGEDFNVYLDEAYPGFGTAEGEPLFTERGEQSPMLKQALAFLGTFQGEVTRTRLFTERLRALNLLIPRVLEVARPDSQPMVLQGFSVVDEGRLMALPDGELLDLARSGLLAWVHAHLMSLGNVTKLKVRLDARIAAAKAPAAKPPPPGPSKAAAPAKRKPRS